jgi:hypothetical protein
VTTRATKADKWRTPVNLGPTVNSSSEIHHGATISSDGLSLYFASNRAGGFGSWDLWVTKRATLSDLWGPPVNLGSTINSSNADLFPSISSDGLLLFFDYGPVSASGPDDLWVTRRATVSDPWGLPVNLGPRVNTSADDGASNVSADGRTLYFTSDRPGGYGVSDIWQAPIIPIIDFNGDEKVDLKDFSRLAQYWGQDESSVDIGPMPWGDGVVDIQDVAVLAEYWLKEILLGLKAENPVPANGAINIPKSIIQWSAGENAAAHDVYFGSNETAVTNATPDSPEYIEQTNHLYSSIVSGLQLPMTTYYWRIDEVVDEIWVIKGDIWHFTTAPLKAHTPVPADGELYVDPNLVLTWGAGFNVKTTSGHRVYFGTDATAVANATTSTAGIYKGTKSSAAYTTGLLSNDTNYYWRIDEVNKDATVTKGDVWMFKTILIITINDTNLIGWRKLDEGQGTLALELAKRKRLIGGHSND